MKCGWSDCFTCPYNDCVVDVVDELGLVPDKSTSKKEYFKKYNDEHKAERKAYREANREKYVNYSREYYQKNKERLKAIERDRIRLRRQMQKLAEA